MDYPTIFRQLNCCVIIPTYNNAQSIGQVIEDVLAYTDQVIIVDDGSTDETSRVLAQFPQVQIHAYKENVGKGHALQTGFAHALSLGYMYAITIDADGQHYAKDLPQFLDKIREEPGSLIVGARNMEQESVPGGSSFGHRFSNFWYKLETGIDLPDTQSGYRLYPLSPLAAIRFFTKKYEFEIEVLVRAAWRGIVVSAVPISVYYPPKAERISHFRPFTDFSRISLLNTVLVLITFLYIKPRDFFRYLKKKRLKEHLHDLFLKEDESVLRKSLAVSLGIFMGIVPFWGYQLVSAIGLAYLFKLNRAIVIVTANISIPPMIPLIIYGSYLVGGSLLGDQASHLDFSHDIGVDMIAEQATQYILGSFALAAISAIISGIFTYIILHILMKPKKLF